MVHWVDYSNKYGMGYYLSNGSFGVYFNDCTKTVLMSDARYIPCIVSASMLYWN